MAAPSIFISYRRGDAAGSARGLYMSLKYWYGEQAVFFDQADLMPGDVFPDRLRQAIEAAPIMLVVIGPTWLEILNARARAVPAAVDVVREEVKLALARRAAQPGQRWVVPLLLEHHQMPDENALHPALKADLAGLWQHDAASLAGKQARWECDLRELLRCIDSWKVLQPLPSASDAERLRVAEAEIAKVLALPPMQPLVQQWGAQPLAGKSIDKLSDVVVEFYQAVEEARDQWSSMRLSQRDGLKVREGCRDCLSTLYALAVDGVAARTWLEEPSGRTVPVSSSEALFFGHALVHGRSAKLSPSMERLAGVVPEGLVDLSLPDPGAGGDRRRQVHQTLWKTIFNDPRKEYPTPQSALEGDTLKALQERVKARQNLKKSQFMVTDRQGDTTGLSDLPRIAGEFGIPGLSMAAKPDLAVNLLRVDQDEFNALMAECLQLIESIE